VRLASGTVLGLAALVSSPALYQAYAGGLPLDLALTRYLIAAVVVWAALSTLAALVGPAPGRATEHPLAGTPSAAGESAENGPLV
jgi:hypothetical protein